MPPLRPPLVPVLLLLATAVTTSLAHGPLYALALLAILGAHEMGHFVYCRRHRVQSTWPLFLPFLPLGLAPGTLGAVIRVRSPYPSRKALLDIGAAGPLAGLVLALPITWLGLVLSKVGPAPAPTPEWPRLGTSLVFEGLALLAKGPRPPGHDVFLHPLAIAGWFGLLVTSINLLPIGQLDGGHVVYALVGGAAARRTTNLALGGFAAVTVLIYNWWILFFAVVAILARRHPAPVDDHTPLDGRRRAVAWLTLAFFVLTFVPAPLQGLPGLWSLAP
jgi:membrane-associated protease RseP (regulator of RpoE activity)